MKNKKTGCVVGAIALGILAICMIAGIIWVGIREYQNLPRQVTDFDFGNYSLDEYAYSPEQTTAINEYGNPPSFTILFYHEEDPDGKKVYVRHEIWDYPSVGKSLVFENGYRIAESNIEPYAAVPIRYQPASFRAFMNREQIAKAAELDEWFILPVEEELLYDADLYYADGLTFGLQADELVYIEAVGFEDPNAPAAVLPSDPEPEDEIPVSSTLTPEEIANQGTHTFTITMIEDNEILNQRTATLEIVFFEGGFQLIQNGITHLFTQIGLNQYLEDAEDPFLVEFNPAGFNWVLSDNPIETRFVIQE